MFRASTLMGMVALGLVTTAAAAQIKGNDGIALLTALKENDGSKAYTIVEGTSSDLVNFRGADGDAPLHLVIRNKNANWVGYLLARKANPDLAGRDGDTPMIVAARLGFTEAVTRLIASRADVNRANRRGETALIVAVNQRQPRIVKMLLEAGADPDKRDFAAGYSAREYAKRESRMPELLRMIETIQRPKPKVAAPKP